MQLPEHPGLGVEAVRRIEVEDLAAFMTIGEADDDFHANI
ncbi:MAG: fumarate hydratase C-terminal domain-containing protein [Alphaproteobacteria bacterium]